MDNRNIDIIAIFQQFTQLKRDDKQIKRYDKQIKRDNEQLQQDVDRGLKLVSVRDNAHMPHPYFVHCLLPFSSLTVCRPKNCRTNSKTTARPYFGTNSYINM